MFGTVILDAYTLAETKDLAYAIDDLCSPNDSYGWASAGIYSFWDYNTHEVLYIGLASDLAIRFQQHNGLLSMPEEGCKYAHIQEYFTSHEKLGYTIFVQSPFSQPMVHRDKELFQKMAAEHNSTIQDYVSDQGITDIKRVEGILIESFNKYYGRLPAWNKVGGSIEGQRHVMPNNINIVKSFSETQLYAANPIVSRSTIRELSNNSMYEGFESFLHSVRIYMLIFGMDYSDALTFANSMDSFGWYQKMSDAGYLEKPLVL